MMHYQHELILTGSILVVLLLLRLIVQRIIIRRILRKQFDKNRRKVISKVINFLLFAFAIIAMVSVWGLEADEVVYFVGSMLAVLGVALFAQWSHLSNVTAGVIIFFDANFKIGDEITILDKDFPISGSIEDIDSMSLKIRIEDGSIIAIPNNVFLQKAVKHNNKKEL
jgi:small-conductance mechanosensitive channel